MCGVTKEDFDAVIEFNRKLVRDRDDLQQEVASLELKLKHAQSHLDWWREVAAKESGNE
jgi:uncharacterized protein YydD (DUF2326 family)